MKWIISLALTMISAVSFCQSTSFVISARGDTLNRVDQKGLKQGKWSIHVDALREEPGYTEQGVYIDGKKNGKWTRFNSMGDLLATENYKMGNKDGLCSYFTIDGLLREERWLALDYKNAYDTVQVISLQDGSTASTKIMKANRSSVKQGTWNYYNPTTGRIVQSETYEFDTLYNPFKKSSITSINVSGAPSADTISSAGKAIKPAAIIEYEKKNSGKKKIKVRTGSTGY